VLAALPVLLWLPQAPSQSVRPDLAGRRAHELRREITTLPQYSVFDDVSFELAGAKVVLLGRATRPALRSSVENVVKRLEWVASVENRIQVLPLSRNDDNLRAQLYLAIYYDQSLIRYSPNRGVPAAEMKRRLQAGKSGDPPAGYHPIHIIVAGGNVALEGVVDSEGDKSRAGVLARQVSGVFSVKNNLKTAGQASKR